MYVEYQEIKLNRRNYRVYDILYIQFSVSYFVCIVLSIHHAKQRQMELQTKWEGKEKLCTEEK